MRCIGGRLGLTALLAGFSIASQAATVAGVTPGSFRVSETGAASYTIPIQVPPGIAGMEPKVSLVYNSQAGNGLLGVGWNLEGLSAITRCPRTLAQDGVRGSVNYDWNDRYCLDGQRLIIVSGTYGGDGAEYRTERDTYSKVVSRGVAGNGPAWWEVWTKSGLRMEYGRGELTTSLGADNARVLAAGKPSVRVWAINRLEDRKANKIYFGYVQQPEFGSYRPYRIEYISNADDSGGTDVSAVWFQYEVRPDYPPSYHAGSEVRDTWRMKAIETWVRRAGGWRKVSAQNLSYSISSGTQRSVLISIQSCDDGVQGCYPATTFSWQGDMVNMQSFPHVHGANFNPMSSYPLITADFNGDGRTDYARMDYNKTFIYLANADGTFSYTLQQHGLDFSNLANFPGITGDFNGDGKEDYARLGPTLSYTFLSNGNGTFNLVTHTSSHNFSPGGNFPNVTGDFNGDGLIDFARLGPSKIYTYLSNGNGTFTHVGQQLSGLTFSPLSSYPTITGDFNGDGKMDFARLDAQGTHIFFSVGDGTFTYSFQQISFLTFSPATAYPALTGDFNGDGKTDYLRLDAAGAFIFLSRGDGTFSYVYHSVPYNFSPADTYPGFTGDFNGDGKTDYARMEPTMTQFFLSNGDGTFIHYSHVHGQNYLPVDSFPTVAVDFNGDGRTDYARYHQLGTSVFMSPGKSGDSLVSINGGLGAVTTIAYKPLTDPGVYVKDAGGASATYPTMDLQVPLYVVSSVSASNAIGGTISSTYTYGGLKVNYDGRGFLGFRWTEFIDGGTGLKTRSEYRQDFPYLGMLSKSETAIGSTVLREVQNDFSCMNPANGVEGCPVTAGNRYFPFIYRTVETANDLSGTFMSKIRTSSIYEGYYGNPTFVTVEQLNSSGAPIGTSKITSNWYYNDPANWILSRLTKSQVQSQCPDRSGGPSGSCQ